MHKSPSNLTKRVLQVFGTVSFFGLVGCIAPEQQLNLVPDTSSPKGAAVPDGLAQIKEGMTQPEVLEILGALYPVIHAAAAYPSVPIADFFVYTENGKTKYIEIYYDGIRVFAVRFGYEKPLVIE